MKINGNEIQIGNIIELHNDIFSVSKVVSVKPGKGGAFTQAELKSLTTGHKKNERFRSNETVEKAYIEEINCQFLYFEHDQCVLMRLNNFEQIYITREIIGEKAKLLDDGMEVKAMLYNDKVLSIKLPSQITVKIQDTEAVIKGQTATSSYKTATTTNNIKVMIPPFVGVEEKIIIDSETIEYIKRA